MTEADFEARVTALTEDMYRVAATLLRGHHVDELVHLVPHERPAGLQVLEERVGLVLGYDADAPDAGVDAVREREVDDAELAAEIDRGLRPGLGELLEPAAAPSGEHQSHGVLYCFPVNHRCAP